MVIFLKEVGLYNIEGVILLSLLLSSSLFFMIRTGVFLYYIKLGTPTKAKITSNKNAETLVNKDKYDRPIRLRSYTYEYMDDNGITHSGAFRAIVGVFRYQIGDEVEINYLKSNEQRSRMYTIKHWFMYEFIILITIILLLSMIVYIVMN